MKGDTMKKDYINNQQADIFLVGFIYKELYYITMLDLETFMLMSKYDKTSKSHGRKNCLRFKPTVKQKRGMIATGAICYCDNLTLQREKIGRENNGQVFERLMCKEYSGIPCKDRFWWTGGDFECYDKIIQVKLENGTLCTAEQCKKLRAEA